MGNRSLVQLALLSEGDHQQIAVGQRAPDAPLLRLQVDALSERRLAAVHLAQLEQDRIEQVIDHPLVAAAAVKSTRRLSDQDVGVVQRRWVITGAVLARCDEPGLEMLPQLLRQVPGADSGTSHSLDYVRRVHGHFHVRRPSHTPRVRATLGRFLRSSHSNAAIRPTPRCRRATQ